MPAMKPLSTNIYTFEKLIDGGCLYIDKTEGILKLLEQPYGQYFMARPRRFGKSLLISTLKAIFQGKRNLFEGLFIDRSSYDWTIHPVIHLNLGSADASDAALLEELILRLVEREARVHDIQLTGSTASQSLQELIEKLNERGTKVVVLIDEYDNPLLNHIGSGREPEIQRVLKSFYSVIKTTEEHQRFAFITGVSQFSKVSIFSDLNNITDLTMTAPEASLLGYTQDELEQEFNNYWFETATPTFLVNLIKSDPIDLIKEFKLNGSAEDALKQIEEKQYARPYMDDPRNLLKVGIEFGAEIGNIERWLVD